MPAFLGPQRSQPPKLRMGARADPGYRRLVPNDKITAASTGTCTPGAELAGALAEADWDLHRAAVFGAAYRILGSVAEAEDVTQEVWLRASATDLSDVLDLRAWLVTVAARTSYNLLKS